MTEIKKSKIKRSPEVKSFEVLRSANKLKIFSQSLWIMTAIVFITTTLMVSSCGFKLRSAEALPFSRLHVVSKGFSLFAAELRREVQVGGITKVVEANDNPDLVLNIVNETKDRKVLSVSKSGDVREFTLRYVVSYMVKSGINGEFVINDDIVVMRDLTYNDTQALAKESEESILYEEMVKDGVRQMLLRLSKLSFSTAKEN